MVYRSCQLPRIATVQCDAAVITCAVAQVHLTLTSFTRRVSLTHAHSLCTRVIARVENVGVGVSSVSRAVSATRLHVRVRARS
jgi:hypothetical protein